MSQRVDFYLLSSENSDSTELLACRLLEKAYDRGHRVFVYCQDKQQAERLDELLWTFKPEGFIPHHLQGEGPKPPAPIQLGHSDEPRGFNDILMNLNHNIPSFYTRFNRVIEIVATDEVAKEISRNHYRQFKQNQCQLHIHEITL